MAENTWTLTDVELNQYVDSLTLDAGDLARSPPGCSISKRSLRGGLREGVDLIEIDNGAMKIAVLPTRGMGIWRAWLGDRPLGWQSPVQGPVHPCFVPLAEPSGLGWLEGFDEFVCRCGLTSNGAPQFDAGGRLEYPLHGRIANLPAVKVDVGVDPETGELFCTGVVEETRFLFHKLRLTSTLRTLPGERGFRIEDAVSNHSDRPGQMQLLYHINVGRPFLTPDARFVAPVTEVVPRDEQAARGVDNWHTYGPEQADYREQVYFCNLAADDESGQTRVMLVDGHGGHAVSLGFSTRQLPCFTLWKNTTGAADGYVTGLEPGVNLPNPREHEAAQGRVVSLSPGEGRRFELEFKVHPSGSEIAEVEAEINRLRGDRQCTVHQTPQPGWCPV